MTQGEPAQDAAHGARPAAAHARPRRLDAVETIFQTAALSVRRSARGGRLVAAAALILFPLLLSIPVSRRAAPGEQERFFYDMLGFYHFGIAVPGVALAFATAFPWPEAEEGTLTYWFTAPVRRWAVHLGRFLAAAVLGAVALPLAIAAIAVPLQTTSAAALQDVAVAAVSATLLAFPTYLAFFWLVATVFRKGLAIGVVFILIENFVSMVPANIVKATMIHYVRSFVHPSIPKGSRGVADRFIHGVEPATMGTAVLTFAALFAVYLVLSLLLVEWIEYRGKTSQAT